MAKKPAMYTRDAKKISYGDKRDLSAVIALVFHYTGNVGDTARNNADYYATGNDREAGAHLYVSRNGDIAMSIPLNRVAYAVGGFYTSADGAGEFYKKVTNANSISIELCDCATKEPSWEQLLACRQLYLWIKDQCPNLKMIVRHWDVNGKKCPARMTGRRNKNWKHFRNKVMLNYQFKARITKDAAVRSSKGVKPGNKIGAKKAGQVVCISKVVGSWGRLLNKSKAGKFRWISLKKTREI